MILAKSLPDAATSSVKQSTGTTSKSSSADARAQFGGILQNLSEGASNDSAARALKDNARDGKPPAPAGSSTSTSLSTTSTFLAAGALQQAAPGATTTSAVSISASVSGQMAMPNVSGQMMLPGASGQAVLPGATTTATPVASLQDILAALPASLVAQGDNGVATASVAVSVVSKRRADGKADVTTSADTQASATDPTQQGATTLLSGLLGLTPTVPNQPAAAARSAPSGGATAASSLAASAGSASTTASDASMIAAAADHASSSAAASSKSSADEPGFAMVKSVSVETQLAPSPAASPMQQVIFTVQKLVASEGTAASASAPAETPVTTTLPSRTMTIVLEPENLGTVTVKMQLRGGSLDLQLDVANTQTLGLLTKDKDTLTAAMSGQDYQIGTLTMRASDTQNASQGSDNGSQNQDQSSGSSQNGSAQQDSRGGSSGSDFAGQSGSNQGARQNGAYSGERQASQRDARPAASADGASGVYI